MSLLAHQGHEIHLIGLFHLVILHFPIATIIMTWIAEIFYRPAARFLIAAAALTALLTMLSGFALAQNAHYTDPLTTYYEWHRTFGILTSILALATWCLKELSLRSRELLPAYYYALIVLTLLVIATGYFGGYLSFNELF